MFHLDWQGFELYKHVKASQAAQLQATTDDAQQTSLLSAPVNPYEDPTTADTQHQVTYGVYSTSNNRVPALVGLHDADPSQSDISGPLPGYGSVPLPPPNRQIDQFDTHCAAAGQPAQISCLWTNQCGFAADTIKSMLTHISSQHFRKKQQSASQVQCHICSPPMTIRRDTIRRHIREIHYRDKYRRKRLS